MSGLFPPWSELQFATPHAAWLLLLVAALSLQGVVSRPTALPRAAPALVNAIALPGSWRRRCAALLPSLRCAAWLLLVLAAMRPVRRVALPQSIEGIDIVVALDLSSSMAAEDLAPGETRLAVAKRALDDFLRRRPEDRIALLSFARWPDLLVPLTRDHAALRAKLEALTLVEPDGAEDATGIGTALARALQLLEKSAARSKVIVLLTDGVENVATAQTPDEIAPLHAAQRAAQSGVRIDPIVVGRGDTDTREVEAVASRTGGTCFTARDAAAVAAVCAQIDGLERTRLEAPRWHVEEWFAPFVAVALALLLAARAMAASGLEVLR